MSSEKFKESNEIQQLSIAYTTVLQPLFEAWNERSLEKLNLSKRDSTEETQIMMQRNLNMARQIVRLVNDKEKNFCCMGVDHTTGEMNVQTFLKKLGLSTEKILI